MAVTIHNTTLSAGPTSAAARTVLHTATAGSVLLVWIHRNEATTSSAVAAGTNPLTLLAAVSASGSRSELWGLTAPPSGTLTISAAPVGANVANWSMIVTSYVGQRSIGGSPFGTPVAGTSGATTTVNFSVSSTSTDLVAFGFGISANVSLAFNNGTTRGTATHSTTGRLVVGDIAGNSTVSISATAGGSVVWSMLGVPLVASAAPITNVQFDNAAHTATLGIASSRGLLLTATTNACLLVFINVDSGSGTISSVAVGSTPLTKLGEVNYREAGGFLHHEVWGLTAAPSGVLTISAAIALDLETAWGIAAVTYTGHRNSSPFGTVVAASGSATTNASLVISASVDSRIVVAFASNDGNVSVGSGLIQRIVTDAVFPNLAVADVPGFPLATAQAAQANIAADSFWGILAVPIVGSTGAAVISGSVSVTDIKDSVAAPGYLLIRGQVAVADARDTVAAPSRNRITGQVAVTDRADTVAATATARITGQVAVTDVKDSVVATGYLPIRGQVAVADARDSVAAPGYVLISAIAAVVDRMDTIAVLGSPASITGTVSVTDAPDTAAVNAQVRITAAVNVTDRPDTFVISGTALASFVTGTVSITDQPDSVAASGYVLINGAVNATDRPDSAQILINNISASAEVVTTLQDLGSGGGGRKQRKPPYIRAPEDFWAIRERHLKSIHEEMVESAEPVETVPAVSIVPEPPKLVSYRIERASVIQKLTQAEDRPKLYNRTKRLKQLNANIAEQKRLRLLEQQKLAEQKRLEKKRRNLARARKLKKAVKLLAIARALSTLTYLYGKL